MTLGEGIKFNRNNTELIGALRNASDYHTGYSRSASEAQGVDRHLFGLEMLLSSEKLHEITRPQVLDHPLYQRSKHWKVSTSTLPIPPGFGPVVDDGVGIGYFIDKNSIYFCITSRKEQDGTIVKWAQKLEMLLDASLKEMMSLHGTESLTPKSRL